MKPQYDFTGVTYLFNLKITEVENPLNGNLAEHASEVTIKMV